MTLYFNSDVFVLQVHLTIVLAELHWQIHLRHMPICWRRQKTKGYWDDANSNASPDPRPIFITKPCFLLLLSNNSGKGCFFRERKRDVAPFTCTYGGAKHRLSSWNNTEWWQPFALSAASPCSFHPRYLHYHNIYLFSADVSKSACDANESANEILPY